MSNYQRAETEAVNDFLAAVHYGRVKITALDAVAICQTLNDQLKDAAESMYANYPFDLVANDWGHAIDVSRAEIVRDAYMASPDYTADLFAARSERGL